MTYAERMLRALHRSYDKIFLGIYGGQYVLHVNARYFVGDKASQVVAMAYRVLAAS